MLQVTCQLAFQKFPAPGDALRVHGRNPIVLSAHRHAEPSTGVTALILQNSEFGIALRGTGPLAGLYPLT